MEKSARQPVTLRPPTPASSDFFSSEVLKMFDFLPKAEILSFSSAPWWSDLLEEKTRSKEGNVSIHSTLDMGRQENLNWLLFM